MGNPEGTYDQRWEGSWLAKRWIPKYIYTLSLVKMLTFHASSWVSFLLWIFYSVFSCDFHRTHFIRCHSWILLSLSLGLESAYEWGQFKPPQHGWEKINLMNSGCEGRSCSGAFTLVTEKKGDSQLLPGSRLEPGCRLGLGFLLESGRPSVT